MKRALLTAITGAALLLILNRGGVPVEAQAADPLKFFKNYFVTGDYVVGGVGLRNTGVNGLATGTINVAGVPTGSDIQAAYLYWQVVSTNTLGSDSGNAGVTFRGNPLETPELDSSGQETGVDLPMGKVLGASGSAPCWSAGGGTGSGGGSKRTYTYRADVLRFFGVDAEGKILVNGSHTVQVPDTGGNGNATPIALGASVVVVYRSPDANAALSAVVIYDGSHTIDNSSSTLSQTLKGFYQPATTNPNARITYIGGSGQANKNENLFFDGNLLLPANPFGGTAGNGWDNLTYAVNPGADGAVTTTIDTSVGSGDCLTFGAMVFKTAVQDVDNDGLLDVWETSTSAAPIIDPNGKALPALGDMGASVNTPDIFVEIGYMTTGVDTTYGSTTKPAHSHLPSHEALKLVGDSFFKEGIKVHFDVGNGYAPGDESNPAKNAEAYLIRGSGLARGGEAIDEMTSTLCAETGAPWDCQFKAYPGTVGWKTGFRYLKDEVLSGEPPPAPGEDDVCDAPGATCDRRFDRNRKDIFHYALFAHALGLPKSESPCKNATTGALTGTDTNACAADEIVNPDFRTPRTTTGVGDFPGGDVLVTLGAFADTSGLPIGTPFMQASTLMHELGHNFERRHSGEQSTRLSPNPNCKPTYLSVMNYLYQLRGLLDNAGRPHLDFSGAVGVELNEGGLVDGDVMGSPYRIGWYAPLLGSYLEGKGTPAKSHCDGSALLRDTFGALTEPAMVRIDARNAGSGIDWAANGITAVSSAIDINFNGRTTLNADGTGGSELLKGSNDWATIRLNQVGSRRSAGGLYIDELGNLRLGAMSLDAGRGDYGRGDYGRGDYGRGDYGRGDYGRGDLGRGDYGRGDYGRGDYGRGDYGRGDYGRGDYGGGDLFTGDPNNIGGELDFELAGDLAKTPPNEFTACVIGVNCAPDETSPLHDVKVTFKAPNVGGVFEFIVYRVVGAEVTPAWIEVGRATSALGQTDYTVVDSAELLDGQQYTYFAVAVYADAIQSDASNVVTITAVNAALTAGADAYDAVEDTTLNVPANGVLGNDLDPDSPAGTLTAALVAGPSNGSVTLNADGSFDYTPAANFNGVDTFTYTATDGSVSTAAATVTITVAPVNDAPSATGEGYAASEDTALTVAAANGVLANDSDVDGDVLNAVLVSGPANGLLTLSADGSFVYTPAANYNGPDAFTYYANDGNANSGTVTVTITVGAANDAPTATADGFAAAEDTPLVVAANGVLGNDSDVDGDALTAVLVSGPSNGTLALNANGSFVYTSAANYNGPDAFTYYANDGSANSATVTVTIAVASVNDLPLAGNDAYTTIQGSALTLVAPGVLGNDSDIDGTLTAVLASGPANGTLTLGANGSFTYTPGAGFYGVDSFSYNAWDGTSGTTATVTITVQRLLYVFTGFLSPMVTAGTEGAPSNAGVFSFGKAIPLKWSLTLGGAVVSDLASLKTLVAVPGTYSSTNGGSCTTNGGTALQLLDPTGRPTGNSTYRFGSAQFIFNWDTSAASRTSCYVIKLTLNDGTAAKATFIRFR